MVDKVDPVPTFMELHYNIEIYKLLQTGLSVIGVGKKVAQQMYYDVMDLIDEYTQFHHL